MTITSDGASGGSGRTAATPPDEDWSIPSLPAARKVLIAIPAYNEERFIGSVVLQTQLLRYDVLVVDDGSDDRTAAVAAAAGATVERHRENGGKSAAMNTAFTFAHQTGVTCLVVMDGDAQHDPGEIERLIEPIDSGRADIVIGSRFLNASDGVIPGLRRLGQQVMTMVTNVASGVPVSDSQSGFRAFSAPAIEALVFGSSGFSVEVEMQFQARDHGLTVAEVPISANYLDPPKRNVVSHGMQVLDGLLRLVGQRRPLAFFAYPGLAMLLVGFLFGLMVTDIQQSSGILPVGYGLLTVLFTITGLLSLFTAVILHSVGVAFLDVEKRIISRNGRAMRS